jgi:DNA (cytosine-5)-methyltransferase 1
MQALECCERQTPASLASSAQEVEMIDNLVYLDEREDNMVDLFCGAGGSGGGLLDATDLMGRKVSGTFVNHWDKAILIHQENHPEHRHLAEDLFTLDPTAVFPVGTYCSLLWASPQCTFFSVARGASCVNEQDRSHAHSVTDWVKHLRPEAVIVENVREFVSWGPVTQKRWPEKAGPPIVDELMWARKGRPVKLSRKERRRAKETETDWGKRMKAAGYQPYEAPDKERRGEYFQAWIAEMQALGYESDYRVLKSADYGDPTIRQRLFVYFVRKDSGKKIVWPDPYAGERGTGHGRPMDWRTARGIIQWAIKGLSVFTRDKNLADNTFRRLAIGLVKYGLREFLISSAHGSPKASDCDRRVHDVDQPLLTFTAKGERGLVKAEGEFITPNFGEAPGQEPRTHSVDDPVPTVTSHGAGGVVRSEAYIIPHHAGSKKDWVKGVDSPVSTVTTTMTGEGLVEPAIVQLKGQSTAQSIDSPLTALTASQGHYVMQPEIATLDNQRGTGVCKDVDSPLRTSTAGGCNQAIAEAFMFAIDQTGGARGNDGTYPVDAPVRTIVTKANQTCIEVELEVVSDRFLHACSEKGVDTSRATTFLNHLVTELKRRGKVDAKPWIYVYYSNGSEGKSIDEPLPTVRTKAGHALVYPVIELDGKLIKIDLFYRMLTPLELQRAMGFPDSMTWANCNKSEIIRAIGNSVSRGVSRAIGLAWYSQDSNVWDKVKPIYEAA